MNNQYISFWQNAMNDAFNPDKQVETFNNLFNQTISQFGDISSSLKKLSEGKPVTSPEEFFNAFNISSAEYQKSINEYIKLFGLVSIDEYRALIKKYEKLKKEKQSSEETDETQKNKVETQDKTIKAQKEEISKQKKQLATQKASLTKAKKEMADLKRELAKDKKTVTPKKPAKATKENAK